MIAYISIGNTDNRLTQDDWALYTESLRRLTRRYITHGEWFSEPSSHYQNACFCIEFGGSFRDKRLLEEKLAELAAEYHQDSIAMAYSPQTGFIKAKDSV